MFADADHVAAVVAVDGEVPPQSVTTAPDHRDAEPYEDVDGRLQTTWWAITRRSIRFLCTTIFVKPKWTGSDTAAPNGRYEYCYHETNFLSTYTARNQVTVSVRVQVRVASSPPLYH